MRLKGAVYVRGLMAWLVLIAVFLVAGAGLNMFRIHIVSWLAYGRLADALLTLLGLLLTFLATAFLGGFVYYRDHKRGKLKREGWRGRPIAKKSQRTSAQEPQPSKDLI